jgi:eukaryotic-like serine/threonine-protein kinase
MPTKSLSLFDLAPGKVLLDRYLVKKGHRHGGMATTFEVEDREAGGTRELMVFPAALFESAEQAAEFAETMRAWRKAAAPAVVPIREVTALEDGTTLVVTDFPPGRSLRDWLEEHGPMPPKRAVRVARQLLEGLETLHAAGLVHGDIKPHTIRVTRDHEAVFVDGGITPAIWSAKHLGDKTALIGTPYYAPVEQFGGDAASVQTDVYNLATVLFELVSGTIPWRGKSFLEVFQEKLDKTPPSMRRVAPDVDVPEELERAVARGMMADRRERYASAAEFREALDALKL